MPKIKVLFLAANPTDTNRLQLDSEIRTITERIRAAEYRDALELISAWAVRPDDLLQLLNQHQPHIVHFSGHGDSTGELLLTNPQTGTPQPISSNALTALFATLKDNIRLVFLNACYSESQAQAITSVIDCAIGMNAAVGDDAAIEFAAAFYRAIGFGRSVREAFEQGKVALEMANSLYSATPELLVKSGVDPTQVNLINPTTSPQPTILSPFQQLKLETLQTRYVSLSKQYKEIAQQLDVNLNPVDRLKLERQLQLKEEEITIVDREIQDFRSGE